MIKIIEIGESKKENFFEQVIIIPSKLAPVKRKEPKIFSVCPYCNNNSVRIWVHGHFQCQRCKNVIATGCEAI